MRIRGFRYGLSSCAAVLLAACGGGSPPIVAPGTSVQSSSRGEGSANLPLTSSSYQVLHRFGPYANASHDHGGANPDAGLIEVNGTLYGTTSGGGYNDSGTVYSISATGVKKLVYGFRGAKSGDGSDPSGDLTDVNGTLYGTTYSGGKCDFGTVYSVSTTGTEKVLYSFCGLNVGPTGGVIDVNGTLYGSTTADTIGGAVYSISTNGAYKVLYQFPEHSNRQGGGPIGRLLDVNGTLYGVTAYGGAYCYNNAGCGTVYSVTTSGKEKLLYSFKGWQDKSYLDGWLPLSGLIDVNGTLYGTTNDGGLSGCTAGCGVVYSITTSGQENVLYRFTGGSDGGNPDAALLEVSGTLYGTTADGGSAGDGTVFSMSTSGGEQVLHGFGGGSDGADPQADLIDINGSLYGTTYAGGFKSACSGKGCGTVFALLP